MTSAITLSRCGVATATACAKDLHNTTGHRAGHQRHGRCGRLRGMGCRLLLREGPQWVDPRPSLTHEPATAACGAPDSSRRLCRSIGEGGWGRTGNGRRSAPCPCRFLEPRRAVTACRPHPSPPPSRIGVLDAAVEALGVKAQRATDAKHHPFALHQRQERVVFVAGRYRRVRPSPGVLCWSTQV